MKTSRDQGHAHGRRVAKLEAVPPDARVGYIGVLATGREGDAVGHDEAVGDNTHSAGLLVESPHLPRHADVGAEVVGQAVGGVGEVDLAVIRVDGQVVERVELAAVEVVEDGYPGQLKVGQVAQLELTRRLVRLAAGVEDDESGRDLGALALGGKEELALVLNGTVGVGDHGAVLHKGHLDLADGVAFGLDGIGLFERDLVDGGRLVETGAGIGVTGILDKPHFILGLVPHDGLVENGVLGRLGNQGEGGVGTNDVEELVIIDVEGLLGETGGGVVGGNPGGLPGVSGVIRAIGAGCGSRCLRCWRCTPRRSVPSGVH